MQTETALRGAGTVPGTTRSALHLASWRVLALLALLAGIVAAVGIGWAAQRDSNAPLREIHLVAQDGRFDTPTITARAGERVRLTIANRDSSAVSHDLAIAALGVKSPVVEPGQDVTVTFVARQPGSFVFGCTIHPRIMDGKLVVTK